VPKPRYLTIGRVLKPWGFHGELKIEIMTDFPERFASLQTVYLGEDAKPFPVERARLSAKAARLKLKGIDTEQAAARLRNQLVQIPTDEAAPLPEGKYYFYQLIGLRVKTMQGQDLGEVVDILETGANNVYVVKNGEREVLIPAIEPVVKKVDLANGEMLVEPMEGLL
jgi:16S rRNA processing protein RimM